MERRDASTVLSMARRAATTAPVPTATPAAVQEAARTNPRRLTSRLRSWVGINGSPWGSAAARTSRRKTHDADATPVAATIAVRSSDEGLAATASATPVASTPTTVAPIA